ncbi:M23 family metallopeptidase [Rhizocola hellebori]|uniref:M23 family metallopeptidase n=1 Tax=Rhizocola hellebori TaxID=1392758 RepID=UPI001943B1FB|nr:M23 family metallopeptidase [Rhizocola hellebori]
MKSKLKRAVAALLLLASVGVVQFGLAQPAQAATWVKPVNGTLGQGFGGTCSGCHHGVDIIAARWTPIYAVHAGVVQTSRCGSPNCDIDGSPQTSGCGWYVGINHPDGTGTLYCHMVQRPEVSVGQSVSTGQVIGYVGTSGNSSGPHLHFQTHNGASNNDNLAVNPVPFMSARGVNLAGGSTPPPTQPPAGTYWVDTFAAAPGSATPGGAQTGTLYAGRNYVYCRVWGPNVQVGSAFNHWWLKTDLDSGSPWQNQWVSAYYLSRWGNDVAKDNNGNDIPGCAATKYTVDTFADAPGRSSPGGAQTGTLYAGTNYVYCRVWGPNVQVGSSFNHWWLKTDLDTGNPWQNQWVSAYYLSRWGNDVAKDNSGVDIPAC